MKAAHKAVFLLAATCFAQPSMETAMLAAHNTVRARVGVPPLKWSNVLADQAQGWANRLLAEKRFAHSQAAGHGENLFAIEGALASPAQVVYHWDLEAADFDYSSNTCRKVCGHYTQLVWATSKEVGCGVARNSRREVWVCNYDPPGNYIGRRPY